MSDVLQTIKQHLKVIKSIMGVENVILTQRDGQPIESAGIWLSKNEIFGVCSSTSAIFNVAEEMHKGALNYILIDGERSKILIAPLRVNNQKDNFLDSTQKLKDSLNTVAEFYIIITTKNAVNLGSIFIKMKKTLITIENLLVNSNKNYKPPLRSFDENEINEILESFKVKNINDSNNEKIIDTFLLQMASSTSENIRNSVLDFSKNIPGVKLASVTLNGGYSICKFVFDSYLESEGAMAFSLFDTSRKIIWMLKKTNINNVLCDCKKYIHFMYHIEKGSIFSCYIQRGEDKRLGLFRLLIPQYVQNLRSYLKEANRNPVETFNLTQILNELNI
ncbi:MAG: roadblock/LC7 domain-containing protein [Candidatus Helarchaeota archaeon]